MQQNKNLSRLFNPDEFWRFACEFYDEAQIKDLCLEGQNEFQLNVNMLLLCCWLEQHNLAIAEGDFRLLQEAIAQSDRHLKVLRKQRNALAKGSEEYQGLLQQELVSERQQQQILLDALTICSLLRSENHCVCAYLSCHDIAPGQWAQRLLKAFTRSEKKT